MPSNNVFLSNADPNSIDIIRPGFSGSGIYMPIQSSTPNTSLYAPSQGSPSSMSEQNFQPNNVGDTSGDPIDVNSNDALEDPFTYDPSDSAFRESSQWFFEKMIDYFNAQANFNQNSADREMAYNAEQAKINRDWQEYMQNTYYERIVEGMRRAGLNPQLAALGTFGAASTPSGSMASGSSASVGNYANSLGQFLDYFIDTTNSSLKGYDTVIKLAEFFLKLAGMAGLFK